MGTDLLSDVRREIDARLRELQPFVDEYEELLQALGALSLDGATPAPRSEKQAVAARSQRPRAAKRRAPVRDQAGEAIVGALEHGSHTVAELAVVTAMSAVAINRSVRALVDAGAVRKTEREGKPAWALVAAE